MRRRNRGVIICIGSALAYRSIPFQGPYCAAKAAVRGFVDSLRSELLYERSKIRLTMVHLPAVNTPQFDWARNKFDRKVRRSLRFFCRKQSRMQSYAPRPRRLASIGSAIRP